MTINIPFVSRTGKPADAHKRAPSSSSASPSKLPRNPATYRVYRITASQAVIAETRLRDAEFSLLGVVPMLANSKTEHGEEARWNLEW